MNIEKNEKKIFDEFFILKDQGKFAKALEILDMAKEKYKDYSVIYGLYGTIFFELNDYKKSSENFKRVLLLKPTSEVASLGLFHSYIHLSKTNLALKEMLRYSKVAKPNLYLTTINELLENINSFEMPSQKKIIHGVYNKWAAEGSLDL